MEIPRYSCSRIWFILTVEVDYGQKRIVAYVHSLQVCLDTFQNSQIWHELNPLQGCDILVAYCYGIYGQCFTFTNPTITVAIEAATLKITQ